MTHSPPCSHRPGGPSPLCSMTQGRLKATRVPGFLVPCLTNDTRGVLLPNKSPFLAGCWELKHITDTAGLETRNSSTKKKIGLTLRPADKAARQPTARSKRGRRRAGEEPRRPPNQSGTTIIYQSAHHVGANPTEPSEPVGL